MGVAVIWTVNNLSHKPLHLQFDQVPSQWRRWNELPARRLAPIVVEVSPMSAGRVIHGIVAWELRKMREIELV